MNLMRKGVTVTSSLVFFFLCYFSCINQFSQLEILVYPRLVIAPFTVGYFVLFLSVKLR